MQLLGWLRAGCAMLSSAPLIRCPWQSRGFVQSLTLLLLHGGEVLKSQGAYGRSPECIRLHNGFESSSGTRTTRKSACKQSQTIPDI